jgi:hypothetical protein
MDASSIFVKSKCFYQTAPIATRHSEVRSPFGDWSSCPILAVQRRNLDISDQSELQGWIEMPHCSFVKVDYATRR